MSVFTRTWAQIFPGRKRPGSAIGRVSRVIAHTEAGADLPASATIAQELRRFRAVDAFHRSLGWAGFGYSAMPCQSGRVYQGRGGRRSGAHTKGLNRTALAFMVPGHGDRTPMSEACIRGVRAWIGHEIAAGALTADPTVTGHRDHIPPGQKSCPGDEIYPQLHRLRGVTGPQTAAPDEPEDEEDIVATIDDLRQVVREERDQLLRKRINEAVRLGEAAAAGTIAAIRADVGMDPDPASDMVHVRRIRAGKYGMARVRARLEAAAPDGDDVGELDEDDEAALAEAEDDEDGA